MNDLLTPKQVARAISVSESSIKRWCDRGAIATQYTPGGHRRIPLSGLLEFSDKVAFRAGRKIAARESSAADSVHRVLRQLAAPRRVCRHATGGRCGPLAVPLRRARAAASSGS
ncbi:MAG: helix-turn-helix domain-containing protein [Planctomycetota bacterium]|nr:MAG: helix-turn-helix domain-containing protein [Planctomycetota bacterium]REK24677.1 MAG: helix-turn-helix domain-containing protein [Planctomycetota bacterium]REK40176.1 MAG: helix-turn-helix domain-containing protein [Planctomycetota bacterium]